MARTIDQVERSVLEVVEGWKLTDLKDARGVILESDLAYASSSASILRSVRCLDRAGFGVEATSALTSRRLAVLHQERNCLHCHSDSGP